MKVSDIEIVEPNPIVVRVVFATIADAKEAEKGVRRSFTSNPRLKTFPRLCLEVSGLVGIFRIRAGVPFPNSATIIQILDELGFESASQAKSVQLPRRTEKVQIQKPPVARTNGKQVTQLQA